ncbi:ATP-dependent DNA helicase UvrD/PcrA [Candidatus Velamenicoccus archaeovorus]|uniref:DNA 3'-5' helicase n=1 Tax=Velamenicoccus archaeovorus TaxID=1930593 RepID=A0A410P5L7_VELA1|nr:UvrD-helicase domain-containing protein [Candidatus Velamenicoccus archaeovorus]QAT17368.1 ATP-dependent DNA helicase UvrD/PcrA [Candidatus Velamenicoccus archaeovorus]
MPIQNPPKERFPEVRIVEASAGSGKTYALAARYVELLFLSGGRQEIFPLKHILAVTFSNKAAIEMKERILLLLKKIALGRFDSEDEKKALLSGLGVAEDEACVRAFAVMDQIIKNYNFFQIQTIDSFINAILCGCAFRLGLSARFKIKTEFEDYLAYGVDALVDRASHDKRVEKALLDFLHQYLYLENRSGWFPKKDILGVASDLYARTNRTGGTFAPLKGGLADVARLKQDILADMRKLHRSLPEGVHALFSRKLEEFLARPRSGFAIQELSDFFAREDFPAKKESRVPATVQRLWQKIRQDIRRAAEAEAILVFGPYISIFHMVSEDVRVLAAKEDILFLEELNRQAHVLLDERKIDVPELYYRLATRLKHYLVDEFQDTSPLQWVNIRGMVRESLSVGGSLFYVGDKKQAIYRFRGGDVSLFDAVARELDAFGSRKEFLRHNFRSRRQIVLFANRIFSAQNLKRFLQDLRSGRTKFPMTQEGEEAVYRVFEEVEQFPVSSREGGCVRVWHLEVSSQDEKNERTAEKLIALLVDLEKRFARSDIAILVRENEDVETISEWLIAADIPVESEKTLDIRNNALIKELVSFLKFLQSPIDNLSFASFILGRIFQAVSGIGEVALHDFFFRLREAREKRAGIYFYREFRERFPEAWEDFIEEFFRNVGYVPLYELVISILRRFRCLEIFGDEQAFFMRFLELIKEAEEDHGPLASFLEFFETGRAEVFYVRPPKTDAVKVLTIHKAKGLGFRVCILPFLEMAVKVPGVLASAGDDKMSLIRLTEKSRMFSPLLEEAFCGEYGRCFIDELDSVYVALTRAKDELYIFVPRVGRRPNFAAGLLGNADVEEGEPLPETRVEAATKAGFPEDIPPTPYQDWIHYLKDEFVDSAMIRRRRVLLKGEVVHKILSYIGDLSGKDPKKILDLAVRKASLEFPDFDEMEACGSLAARLVEAAACRPVFYPQGREVLVEKEVIDRLGRTRRIDRLLAGPDECWVVDYKMSDEEVEKGRQQVSEYMGLVSEIFSGRRIRGFLVFCDTASIEEVL